MAAERFSFSKKRIGDLLRALLIASMLVFLGYVKGWIILAQTPQGLDSLIKGVRDWVGIGGIFFLLLFLAFAKLLHDLHREANEKNYRIDDISYLEHAVDLCASAFVSTGVIFTAIGMILALDVAIGGLTSESAKELGAWGILGRLMDGGLTMALGTTVVGGTGGIVMRLTKHFTVGRKLAEIEFSETETTEGEIDSSTQYPSEILRALREILRELREIRLGDDITEGVDDGQPSMA